MMPTTNGVNAFDEYVRAVRVLGIDLATEPTKTGVVTLHIEHGHAVATTPTGSANDDALVEWADGVDRIGIDAPLGWPTAFVHSLSEHHSNRRWAAGPDRHPLRTRRTDRALHDALGITPLSVSTDKLGATALRCAHLQTLWAEKLWDGEPAARDGSGKLVEVYPAATLLSLGIPHQSYKGTSGKPARDLILQRLQSHFELDTSAIDEACIASDHILDGLIAALVAWDAHIGRTMKPNDDQMAEARTEGWIHVRSNHPG